MRLKAAVALTTVVAGTFVSSRSHGLAKQFAYVNNALSGTVSIIDTSTNAVIGTVSVGVSVGVAVNKQGTRVYLTSDTSPGTLSVLDTVSRTVTATIPVGSLPVGVALNPKGHRAYVVNECGNPPDTCDGSGSVSVIDTASDAVVDTIATGHESLGVAVNRQGTRAYVTSVNLHTPGTVSVIETATGSVVATVPVGAEPFGIAVNRRGARVYVTDAALGGGVSVIETRTNSVVATIPVPGARSLEGIAVSPNGKRIYVTDACAVDAAGDCGAPSHVFAIDTVTNMTIAAIPVGVEPFGVAVNRNGARLYVVNQNCGAACVSPGTVSVIDTATNAVITTINVGMVPQGFGLFVGRAP
jgi:YVTN family beta-propeller protein